MVKLFACNKLAKIESDPSLIRVLFTTVGAVDTSGTTGEINQLIQNLSGYNSFYCKLKDEQKNIELILENPVEMVQVKNLLTRLLFLKRLSYEQQDRKLLFNALLHDAIEHNGLWATNELAKTKYREGACMIDEWVDFFLSYTNRDQPEVNNTFDTVLKKIFKKKEWDDNVEELNMLAKLLVRNLKRRGQLNVFFDQQSMICGDKIKDKVNEYCAKTFSFAQLIQWQALANEPDKKNWCYHEYKTFDENNVNKEKGLFFFKIYDVPDKPKDVPNIPVDWKDWIDKALTTVNVVIPRELENDKLDKKCGEIANEILSARDKIINKYLTSIA
jgi:hypothetical protein